MSYAKHTLRSGRVVGYDVHAECDHPACPKEISLGMDHLCGTYDDDVRGADDPGCGRYFCFMHIEDHFCADPPWERPPPFDPLEANVKARAW